MGHNKSGIPIFTAPLPQHSARVCVPYSLRSGYVDDGNESQLIEHLKLGRANHLIEPHLCFYLIWYQRPVWLNTAKVALHKKIAQIVS